MLDEGSQTFRFETFGSEAFWGGTLQLHRAIAGAKLGGVGPGVSPKTALAVGLKVDATALPATLVDQIKQGQVNLDDPATTVALLKLNAVVGVKGFVNEAGTLTSIGLTCAICHSTVDDSFSPGIGRRLDGWAARDLNVGRIVALAPNLQPVADLLKVDVPTVKKVLESWGPARFDAELDKDGKAFRPNGQQAGTLIPPAFGLAGVNLHTWTGFGSVPYWNAFVAVTEMHGSGVYVDARLKDAAQFPVAARSVRGIRAARPTRSRRGSRRCTLISSRSPHLAPLRDPSMPVPSHAAKSSSRARHAARRATGRHSTRSPATTSTRLRRSAWTRSRPIGHRPTPTGRRRSAACGRIKRAASITTGASRRSGTW
jgi:hypothetical protein